MALTRGASVPVGTTVDATHGAVVLTSARGRGGVSQTGTFSGGRFRVHQSRGTGYVTELALVGGSFAGCRAPAAGTAAQAAAKRTPRRRVVRSLWGSDQGGRFRTHGRNSVATVRGTRWLTQDRCDGTLTRVRAGAVAVRDTIRHRTVVVRRGGAYLARAARRVR